MYLKKKPLKCILNIYPAKIRLIILRTHFVDRFLILITDDQLVHRFANKLLWQQPQNVRLTLQWSGLQYLTFVEILVNQTSAVGQAYVLDGGIGYSNVSLAVEAFDTLKLDYDARIYGV